MIRSIVMTCAVLAAFPVAAHAQTSVPPVAPAPVSPKLPRMVSPGTPKPISPGSWVTSEDYPAEAIRNYERGTVRFRLAVDADGKVTGCTVLTSSGSELLDSTACRVLAERARFDPARDKDGRAIASTYENRFRWELPSDGEEVFESWAKVVQFDLNATGEIDRCSRETSQSPTRINICGQMSGISTEARAALAGKNGPVTVELRSWLQIDGAPAVIAADPPGATTVFRSKVHYDVDGSGKVARCDVLEKAGEDRLSLGRYDCRPGVRFPALAEGDTRKRGATAMMSITTRPAAPAASSMPPRYTGTPLTAIEPGSWVTPGDYPAAALRAEEAGKVGFRVDVNRGGAVTDCTVTASSGSETLDRTTCALVRQRARFVAARGPAGDPVAGSYTSRVRWEIPEEPVMPLASWAATVRFTVGADSQVSSCAYKGYAAPDIDGPSPCVGVSAIPRATMRALRGQSKGPVTIAVRLEHEAEGMVMPPVPALAAQFKRIALWSGSFEIDSKGYPTQCQGTIDGKAVTALAAACGHALRYSQQEAGHKASLRIGFFTDGDTGVAGALPGLGDLFE